MSAINLMLNAATDAINELGKSDDFENDGYHFKVDTESCI